MRQKPSARKKDARGFRINRQIRVTEVRLIDDAGGNIGIVPIHEALDRAWEKGLDLVEVGPTETPPVCKIMDFGKLKYRERRKRAAAKSGGGELKELGLSMKISDHDLAVKVKQAKQFLERGHKVKFNLQLRGREKSFQDTLALKLLDRIVELMADAGSVDSRSRGLVGNRLFVIISASKRKPPKGGVNKNATTQGQDASGDREADSPDQERKTS